MLNVAIDTNALYTSQGGTARYIRGLLKGLQAAGDPSVRIHDIAWRVPNTGYTQPWRTLRTFYRDIVWPAVIRPVHLRRLSANLLHSIVPGAIPCGRGLRTVTTLHDLALCRNPGRFRPWHRWQGRRNLENIGRSDRIICVSRFTADEAMKLLSLPASKLQVVYHGVDLPDMDLSPIETEQLDRVPGDFFLFVGALEPGKNLDLLCQAYQLAADNRQMLPPLVIVGSRWKGVKEEGPPPADWIYLGQQPDALLVQLYRKARALVFPSQYEGFGLPVLEAMALGCPVICSPVASLPEVGGEAVCYASPDPPAYVHAMRSLLRDEALRSRLQAAGLAQARKFSWTTCARQTLEVYKACLKAG